MSRQADLIADAARRWRSASETLVLGICGPQASGKSTAVAQVASTLEADGLRIAVLSLDDLYLGRAARAKLAATIQPLLITRGPPGTHDVLLGLRVIDALRKSEPLRLPRFSKAHDEPLPIEQWPAFQGDCDVLLFEGWCVGAQPVPEEALAIPVNALEAEEDADGIWRRWWNGQLAGPTGDLFAQLDRLIYIKPPSFDVVFQWRCQQEHEMIARLGPGNAPAAMSDAQIARFISHYRRLTEWIIAEMPDRADLTIAIDADRRVTGTTSVRDL
jgi:D-glycerate 3-kinase